VCARVCVHPAYPDDSNALLRRTVGVTADVQGDDHVLWVAVEQHHVRLRGRGQSVSVRGEAAGSQSSETQTDTHTQRTHTHTTHTRRHDAHANTTDTCRMHTHCTTIQTPAGAQTNRATRAVRDNKSAQRTHRLSRNVGAGSHRDADVGLVALVV
jgi:hypothetical protein